MTSKINRFFNPKDGTYANVPLVPVRAELFRGKRQFGTDVLIGNWYEDRSKVNDTLSCLFIIDVLCFREQMQVIFMIQRIILIILAIGTSYRILNYDVNY